MEVVAVVDVQVIDGVLGVVYVVRDVPDEDVVLIVEVLVGVVGVCVNVKVVRGAVDNAVLTAVRKK